MTPGELAARNRANARKSTGPRTVAGKAIVAQNARRHGATGRPDPRDVETWFAAILDDPDPPAGVVVREGERGFRALALAEAEARLVMAEEALRAFEAIVTAPAGDRREVSDIGGECRAEAGEGAAAPGTARSEETRPGGRRHRLLKRYLGEARAARRRAFEAWLEINMVEEGRAAA